MQLLEGACAKVIVHTEINDKAKIKENLGFILGTLLHTIFNSSVFRSALLGVRDYQTRIARKFASLQWQ
jgi:hypothetical protein